MTGTSLPKRREFLGKLAAGAVAVGLTGSLSKAFAGERRLGADPAPSDKWLESVTGKHRQFFDMPGHENGMGLIHVRNYLNTLRDTYHVTHPQATAVVSLYGGTTLLGFNDAMWQKYALGNALKVMDGNKTAAVANVFYAAPQGSTSLSVTGAPLPIPADSSISALQQRGGVFICVTTPSTSGCGSSGAEAKRRRICERSSRPTCFPAFSSFRRWSWRSIRRRCTVAATCTCDLPATEQKQKGGYSRVVC